MKAYYLSNRDNLIKSQMKVSTTIPKLDEFFKGGIEDGSKILIVSDMLIDKAMFGVSIMSNRLKEGDNGIYFINNNSRFPYNLLISFTSTPDFSADH